MTEPEPIDAPARAPAYERTTAFETVLLAGGIVAFLALLYTMRDFLNPPLLAAAGAIVLWPLRAQPVVRPLFFAGALLLLLWVLDALSGVLIPFVLVYLLAFLFDPTVTLLQDRYRVPRWVSSIVITAVLLGALALFFLLLVPSLLGEVRVLATRLLGTLQGLHIWLTTTPFLDRLEETGLIDREEANRQISKVIQDETVHLASGIPNFVQSLFRSVSSVLGFVTVLGVFPVILYYTLKDYPFISRRLFELFPTWDGRRDYLMQAGTIVGNYLRGQIIISTIGAINVSIALLLLDVPFALLIGLVTGVLNMIPSLGAILTNVFAIVIVVVFGDPWYVDVVKVVLVLFGQSLLESSVLTPNILSHHVGLHPVLILLSLFVFGAFMGLFGLLIAVPATAILMTIYKAYRGNFTLELLKTERVARGRLFFRLRKPQPAASEPTPEAE